MRSRPLALIVDDDPFVLRILGVVLRQFGIDALTVGTSREFIERMKETSPDFCLVDLNLETLGTGYAIIKAVRNTLGSDPVLIVISAASDRAAIAQALEVGANDYVAKPFDKEVLAAKILRYIKTDSLLAMEPKLLHVPEGGAAASVRVDLSVCEVDELGVKLVGSHLLAKGMAVYLEGAWIEELSGRPGPLLTTVSSTWVDAEAGVYGAVAEFDGQDGRLRDAVRRWLGQRCFTGSA